MSVVTATVYSGTELFDTVSGTAQEIKNYLGLYPGAQAVPSPGDQRMYKVDDIVIYVSGLAA
ncbi:Uncharacterised protein (plasmid) [Tsukamurella tyrosinosolvens]|uniref:Uncharacterized protein n=1 Tax=Tsukamurella tyrosinosolvens TaxID=57704 RepID=A0A1H4UZN0_TSUTY|nr:hypothetical protein [Tsukamurella tyrosinosolvens]KXO91098.1 hypothetical protein AXK58_21960 [Tsukamurella tyrosinosolvens]SEC74010.1 hypothetical protein SAMN04489793_3087 [Tsukamurella tyrosinosolvens]VEH90787.1 Uncharacterised protein [Tsukamurella tyrosinosolvens]